MEIIAAIDIISGKCVRLTKGNFKSKKIYSLNPLKIAQLFQKAGIKRLHLIDLEGAKEGKIKNWKTIEKIAQNTDLLIEFGGGIRDEKDIKKLLNLEIDRVIIGSIALKEPQKLKNFLRKFGKEKIVIAVDIKKNEVYYRGWQAKSRVDIDSFIKRLIKLGIKTVICTDIERDGMLKGPNFSLYKKLIRKFPNLKIIASGGIRNKGDLKKLSKIGVSGAIVGKAIYEKKISLNDLKSFI
ncbi:1-(5-phosphoribosyl)-5-[(5-phosphoribosylamino)methylideneamino]imidazole-4-carboxamide isomerase [bacterium (Candidatus Gribaldobacteria) CG23_combo_of_CG06-09_8_20_14_all_37_87_8]|uniref:1-(5-phosphoribosyl)-5-[(5-phosphoribosylamino)methylideneamino] imidazole-4-carboxamide isomerase n=1 Tax=bacterium (Candidatus Gribaldobacteria) CG23_combo_of_CG06-09_8_20_14_all_37_87_8 TaxID=2014278 RepID=A0A2G9ZFB8_9BACT|nr:MAG: 1-(5-phosphoribosyl)-5-[(5-phosphoribosylamino)methylideneamino]imidazole-4-carboxamide isomerase [bacterium (Candidatus Gribaldobacteria) CG23_combo_of_CG06-09_8_20_14_all_37_87_8]